ncbi:MAG: sigma 54-interacting transcriptional regulator [Candidatus Cloacimonadaceae bacterium]|nr:sigma 54-interacting transcriptional regulator [Candidatus Cloacimonadaceae bacterium]
MPEKLYQKMHSFVSERFDLSHLTVLLKDKSFSHLVEITGKPGSGKSYLINPIIDALKESYPEIRFFTPHPMYFNQFQELLRLLTDIGDDEYQMMVDEHQEHFSTGSKYDFFFYITEQLNQRDLLKSRLLIIDDCDVLDSFSRDFLQYLVHYAEDSAIQIIVITQKRLFPFAEVEFIPSLNVDDMQKLLQITFPDADLSYITESEIIQKISDGNLLIVEKILREMLTNKPKQGFDLSPFLEKTFDPAQILHEALVSLTRSQRDMLISMLLLDAEFNDDLSKELGFAEGGEKDMSRLRELGLVGCYSSPCIVQKKGALLEWLHNNPDEFSPALQQKILAVLTHRKLHPQVQARLLRMSGKYKAELFQSLIDTFAKISDNDGLLELYDYAMKHTRKAEAKLEITKKTGLAYSDKNQKDKAIDYYRQCLHICTENSLPAEEIIHLLATALFAVNSSAFALEIIKKYSPATIDPYWKAKILLLKADILTESEKFDDAFVVLDAVLKSLSSLEDKVSRYLIQAEAKKTKGKIHYYINEWDQSEEAFKDSETMYNLAKDHKGLAAIFNNLGVLYMFQGDWGKSEQYFLNSLALEKEHFNLNGISVCYNNLGGLMDDKGDPQRSLFYLEEALKLQKMLNEPYNITNIYNNIGVTWMDHSEYDKAEDALKKSLETAIEFGFYRNTVASLNNLGALYFKKGDWARSIAIYEQGISKSQDNDFTEGLLRSFNNLGEVYEKQNELNLAYDLYFKGIELLPTVSDEYIKAELYGNLGSVLTKLHKFKEAYSYLVESFDFFKSINARDKIIEGCQKQAYYFILTRNYESADYYISQAQKLAEEQNRLFELGKAHYLRALLERKNPDSAKVQLNEAIKLFVQTANNYELSLANYELAEVLFDLKEWEQALHILKNNKKIIQKYGSIKLLEQNDILMQKINREYSMEMKDLKFEENLLNKFYEITQNLNTISDLDVLIEQSLSSLIDISDADGGILCLHTSGSVPDSWDYKIFRGFSTEDPDYDTFMNLCTKTYQSNKLENLKQPSFAPVYNNIILIPLSIRKSTLGVVLLYCKSGSQYFPERIINLLSALCNQVIVIIENIRSTNLEKTHAIIREQLNSGNLYANIIGKSPEMMNIFDIIEKVKDTPTTVLLEGPSGTGKELIARALHYSSNRSHKAFVAQYCGALPETLLESELFGHVKGSFTGAAYDKKGLFEIADGGTFFLDEIADISQSTQAKLLRFLQEGEIKRVGATKTEKVNVRVLCATNVSLLDRVKKGDFRLDLYYRLNVIRIEVPPLKHRPGDVPLLAIHFLDKYNKRVGKTALGITDEAMKTLEQYDWPGNVRQLENELERAVTLCEEGTFIKSSDFSDEVRRFMENMRMISMLSSKRTLKDAIEELERQMIAKSMETCEWNQTQAAKELGLSRQGLIKKLKRYNLYKEED